MFKQNLKCNLFKSCDIWCDIYSFVHQAFMYIQVWHRQNSYWFFFLFITGFHGATLAFFIRLTQCQIPYDADRILIDFIVHICISENNIQIVYKKENGRFHIHKQNSHWFFSFINNRISNSNMSICIKIRISDSVCQILNGINFFVYNRISHSKIHNFY